MSVHRCRVCRCWHVVPDTALTYPASDVLADLEPFLGDLLQAAQEFDELGFVSAVEFVEWVAVDIRRRAVS